MQLNLFVYQKDYDRMVQGLKENAYTVVSWEPSENPIVPGRMVIAKHFKGEADYPRDPK